MSARVARFRARRRQRGAALMLVVLITTMLMTIGLFAARSATLATAASGYDRQMTQTHYVAEYGVLAATNRLSQNAQGFMLQMTGTPDTGCQQGLYATYLPVFTCARLALADMQQLSGQTFLPPGALGNVNLEGDFIIEMSDLSPGHAHAGESQNAHSPTALKYMQVTFTATGQVRPVSLGPTATQPSAESASLETQRVHLTFGPLSP